MENVHEQITKAHIELSEEALEKLVLKQVMNPESADNCIFVKQYFKSHFFKNTDFSFLYNIVNNYWKIYNKQPTIETLISIFDNEKLCDKKEKFLPIIKDIYNISENNYDVEFVKNNLINFTKGRAIYFAILDNLDDIEKTGNIGNCLERFEDIVKIGISDDVGTEYFENIDKHCQELTNVEQRIPFGFKEWDKYTYGGIPNDTCLFMIMAQPGLGKSQMMMNIGYQWLLQNKNVLMISLEMSEQMYSSRMSALFSDINVNELKDNIITLKHKVSVAKLSAPSARLYIKQYSPNEFNAIKLKSILKKLADTKNFKPDLIIVDYLNIMTTNNASYHLNSYERVGTISKELRSVSIETKIPILSATQSNRCVFSDTIVNEKTRGNIRIADVNIGDLLLSNNGMYNKVVKKYDIEVSKTYKITTKSGKTIICTDKHEWPTINGNKTIITGLSVGDVLFKKSLFSCVAEKIGKFINKIKKWFYLWMSMILKVGLQKEKNL